MNGGRGRAGTAAALGCVLVVGVALAGCTPQPPTTTPPPSPSVVATPSPTPTTTPTPDAAVKPERPAGMDEVSAAGAEAAAVYFLQLFPYVFATGDLTEWRELSHPECIYCTNVSVAVEDMFAAGDHSEGGLVHISEVTTSETTETWWLVTITYDQEPSSTVGEQGELREAYDGGSGKGAYVIVIRDAERWLVRELEHVRGP